MDFLVSVFGALYHRAAAQEHAVVRGVVCARDHPQQRTAGQPARGAAVPFTPLAKSIASDGTVSDGPGPLGMMASGYTILTADSLDEAVTMAKGCPMLDGGGQISVFEAFPAM